MGLFDTIYCNYPLPNIKSDIYEKDFQTKSLDCVLNTYTITEEGRLIHHTYRYEEVPEEEREYYGTSKWEEDGIHRLIGCIKSVPTGDVDTNYNGEINFYTITENDEWLEFNVIFYNGALKEIKRVERNYK